MDRINGADTIDIGGGKRGFRSENLVAGVAGTEVTDLFLNSVQEEILKVVEAAGLIPDMADWSQLWKALKILGLSAGAKSRRWTAVNSMTLVPTPAAPATGDTYLVPGNATGVWAGNGGKIAEWTGTAWSYYTPPDGHGISLPDGRIFERVDGAYIEKVALDVQSGKWNYAAATGTANALTATLVPALTANAPGVPLNLLTGANENSGAATLNAGPGALPIVTARGQPLKRGDLPANSIIRLVSTGASWMITGGPAYSEVRVPLTADAVFYVRTDGNDGNDGLTNSAAGAFQTLQGAYNTVRQRYFANGYSVTFQLGIAGSYVGLIHGQWPGKVIVKGDAANRPTYQLTTIPGLESVAVASNSMQLELQDLSLVGSPSGNSRGLWAQGGTILGSGLQFRIASGGNISGILAENGGTVFLDGSIEIFYLTDCFANILSAARLYFGAGGSCTITLQTALALSRPFVIAAEGGLITRRVCTFAGSGATGQRYSGTLNSIINTSGGGANFFPGSVAGTVATGAQYA